MSMVETAKFGTKNVPKYLYIWKTTLILYVVPGALASFDIYEIKHCAGYFYGKEYSSRHVIWRTFNIMAVFGYYTYFLLTNAF